MMSDIKHTIRGIISKCGAGLEVDSITDDTNLVDDLNFSSINLIQLVVDLENEFKIVISDENLTVEKLSSLESLTSIVNQELGEQTK